MRRGIKWTVVFLLSRAESAMALAGWEGAELRYEAVGAGFAFPSPLMHRTMPGPQAEGAEGLWKATFFFSSTVG